MSWSILGCFNKIPQTGWLINNKNLFLTALEAGMSKIMELAGVVSGERLLNHRHSLFTCSHMVEGARKLCPAIFLTIFLKIQVQLMYINNKFQVYNNTMIHNF